jgi:hypothetical protein
MKKISKREILAFIFGLFVLFLIDTITDWDSTVKAFKSGVAAGSADTTQVVNK